MIVGYVPHAFDMFNVEHLDLIRAARARADVVILGVLSDEDVVARHGRPPVIPLGERLEILRHVRAVDTVVVYDASAIPLGAQVLVAADDAPFWPAAEALPELRTSTSAVLRHALRDVANEAVA